MNRRVKILLLALVVALFIRSCNKTLHAAESARYFRFVGVQDQEFVLQPMIVPLFSVVQTAGPRLQEHSLIACKWSEQVVKTEHGDAVPVMVGRCEQGIELRLRGIDLNH